MECNPFHHFECRKLSYFHVGLHIMVPSYARLRAHDHSSSSTLIGGKGRAGPSSLLHYTRETNGVCECTMDVKSTWIPIWHVMDHVSWSLGFIFKNQLLEVVGLPQNHRETTALRTITTVGLFHHVRGPT